MAMLLVLALVDEPAGRVGVGQAPVVAGNLAAARELALEDALRQTVETAMVEILAPSPLSSRPALRPILGRARVYVKRYRILEQLPPASDGAGVYQVRVAADVDTAALRREIERVTTAMSLAQAPSTPSTGGKRPGLALSGTGPVEATAVLSAALAAAGVLVVPPTVSGTPTPPQAGAVTASAATEGPIRGTSKLSIQCRIGLRVSSAAGSVLADETTSARGFAEHEPDARAGCWGRAAAALVPRVVPALGAGGESPGGTRIVTMDVDIVEPAALSALLKSVRAVASVSSAELRRILSGRAEVRVTTRLAARDLAAAVTREAIGALAITTTEAAGDLVKLRVRGAPSSGGAAPAGDTPQGLGAPVPPAPTSSTAPPPPPTAAARAP